MKRPGLHMGQLHLSKPVLEILYVFLIILRNLNTGRCCDKKKMLNLSYHVTFPRKLIL